MKLVKMAEKNELPTISREVEVAQHKEKKHKRISLPPEVPLNKPPILKYSHSHNWGTNKTPHVPPTIPEVEITEDNTPQMRNGSARSHTMTNGKRPNSLTVNNGYENGSYDGPLPGSERSQKLSFDTRSNYSNMSSRNPSLQSLQVQREQYCCASKWSPCERKLVALVSVLATIIVILVIVVGCMAGNENGIEENFRWHF